jgi:hypothetical protein
MITFIQKKLCLTCRYHSTQRTNIRLLILGHFFYLVYFIPTKSNICSASSFISVISKAALYTLLTFRVSNLMYVFLFVQVRGSTWRFQHTCSPKAAGPPLIGFQWLLIQYIHNLATRTFCAQVNGSTVRIVFVRINTNLRWCNLNILFTDYMLLCRTHHLHLNGNKRFRYSTFLAMTY